MSVIVIYTITIAYLPFSQNPDIFIYGIYTNTIIIMESILVPPKPRRTRNKKNIIDDIFIQYAREIRFHGCFDREYSHIRNIELESYYYCSKCRLHRKINDIRDVEVNY